MIGEEDNNASATFDLLVEMLPKVN